VHRLFHQQTPTVVLLLFLVSLSVANFAQSPPPDRITIRPKRVVIIRRGPFARQYTERLRAVVTYPLVSGNIDPKVLAKVRATLSLKNVFGSSLQEYRTDNWLDELSYVVDYNENHILDITFTQNGTAAYPDSQYKHFALNLKTGEVLRARDVFAEDKLAQLTNLVDSALQKEVSELKQVVKDDATLDADGKQNLIDALELQKFELNNLDDFSVSSKGIVFLYDAGFPHVIEALQPEGRYLFPYSDLASFIRPDGVLGQFVK
jgi:hypothetical protein